MLDYREKYLLYCSKLNDCSSKSDVKKHNAAMKQLSKLFHQIENIADKSFLLELLSNENDRTRILVAAHCLGLNVYVLEAKKTLLLISKKKDLDVAFEAKATLDVWKKQGYLKF